MFPLELEPKLEKNSSSKHYPIVFVFKMASLRSKNKLAEVAREGPGEYSRNSQSQNTAFPEMNEDYIIQVSEEIESSVTNKKGPRSSKGQRAEFRALCPSYRIFFWNHTPFPVTTLNSNTKY